MVIFIAYTKRCISESPVIFEIVFLKTNQWIKDVIFYVAEILTLTLWIYLKWTDYWHLINIYSSMCYVLSGRWQSCLSTALCPLQLLIIFLFVIYPTTCYLFTQARWVCYVLFSSVQLSFNLSCEYPFFQAHIHHYMLYNAFRYSSVCNVLLPGRRL